MATPFGVLGGVACVKTNDLKTLPGATAMSMEFSAAANQTLVRFAQAFDGYAYAKLVWHAAENAEQEVLLERLNQA